MKLSAGRENMNSVDPIRVLGRHDEMLHLANRLTETDTAWD